MVSQGDAALRRQLQKSFKLMQQVVDNLESQVPEYTNLLSSVCNLCEQFECCKAVELEATALRKFPEVKTKLLLKLSSEIEGRTDPLKTVISSQKAYCDRLSKQRQTVADLHGKYSNQMSLDTLVRRSATEPSISDMTEWLIDAERALRQQLCCKQHLLETLKYDDSKSAEKLQSTFMYEERIIINQIKEYLDKVSFFMKEDL